MRIAKFEDFHVDGGWDTYSFLKLTTDSGLVGWAEFKESRRRGLAALIHGLGATLIGEDPRAIGRIDAALYSHIRTTVGGLQSNAVGAILNACLDIKGKALGVPVHELYGGALRERIPVYWSRCGVIRARCAGFFDGKVIDRPAVRSLADLEGAGREARERGFAALKTNVLVFDARGGRQYTPGSARGEGHPELNLPARRPAHGAAPGGRARHASHRRPQLQLQAGGFAPPRQEARAVRADVAGDGPL